MEPLHHDPHRGCRSSILVQLKDKMIIHAVYVKKNDHAKSPKDMFSLFELVRLDLQRFDTFRPSFGAPQQRGTKFANASSADVSMTRRDRPTLHSLIALKCLSCQTEVTPSLVGQSAAENRKPVWCLDGVCTRCSLVFFSVVWCVEPVRSRYRLISLVGNAYSTFWDYRVNNASHARFDVQSIVRFA